MLKEEIIKMSIGVSEKAVALSAIMLDAETSTPLPELSGVYDRVTDIHTRSILLSANLIGVFDVASDEFNLEVEAKYLGAANRYMDMVLTSIKGIAA